jgi:hypothetical protein
MKMAIKTRISIDDIIPSTRNDGHFMIDQDKKTGKPKIRKKNKQEPLMYKNKYPMFFRLVLDNPFIPDPVEEYIFHPVRNWRVDICWPEQKLALEVEGGTFMKKGGHRGSISGYIKDLEKYNALAIAGYWLLRFTPQEMESGEAYQQLREWFKNNAIQNH